jgi:hypothetical protein
MFARITPTTLLCGLVGLALAAAAPASDDQDKDPVAKAEKAVKQKLEDLKGAGAMVKHVKDEPLQRAVPKHQFFSVLFRQYPVGRVPPKGLKASNVFAVDADGKVTVLTDAKELEAFCKTAMAAARTEATAKDGVRAWLRLSQEFRQDGFYKFVLMDDATKAKTEKGVITTSGKVVVMAGGNGELNASLVFDAGKLAKVTEEAKIRPGPRPICQATKLLDPDPIVRAMAEQDLLIMGRAAKPYLDEQRARAAPDLQQAIDRVWQRILADER